MRKHSPVPCLSNHFLLGNAGVPDVLMGNEIGLAYKETYNFLCGYFRKKNPIKFWLIWYVWPLIYFLKYKLWLKMLGFITKTICRSESLFLMHWNIQLWLSEVRGFRLPPMCIWYLANFWVVKQRCLTSQKCEDVKHPRGSSPKGPAKWQLINNFGNIWTNR